MDTNVLMAIFQDHPSVGCSAHLGVNMDQQVLYLCGKADCGKTQVALKKWKCEVHPTRKKTSFNTLDNPEKMAKQVHLENNCQNGVSDSSYVLPGQIKVKPRISFFSVWAVLP